MTHLIGIILQAQGGFESLASTLVPFLLIIVVFYFLILRPQQKRTKERAKLLEGVKKGDKVITAGGMHGVVEGVEDKSVLLKIADNVKVKIEKTGIASIVGLTDTTPAK
jgi:preprotein translocase subunit YajC